MAYYSYCCGKYVTREEGVTKRGEGYHCSRCKKELTVYGNPKLEEDKQALKKKRYVKGRGHKVLVNGDLKLIDKLYPFADETTKSEKMVSEKWVVIDRYGRYLTTIMLDHEDGAFYKVLEPFTNRLIKEDLAAFVLTTVTSRGIAVEDLRKQKDLRPLLENLGWKFRKDGKIK